MFQLYIKEVQLHI